MVLCDLLTCDPNFSIPRLYINVSKYNYCFSDFPFPDDVPDYPHNKDMAQYIKDYATNFGLEKYIKFFTKVTKLERTDNGKWTVVCRRVEEGEQGEVNSLDSSEEIISARYVAIASGHHATPVMPTFRGQETFTGDILHSVKFKDALTNGLVGKRVLIVGIGNSAVDAAVNCASVGRCKSVHVSTRSGAWIVPNYVFGHPTDLYACRAFFKIPWQMASALFENIITLISGNPRRWNLNPKMKLLQTQLTVSPCLIHHIQRHDIKIVPNVLNIEGSKVTFVNGESAEFDAIVMCTGYKIDLPFLSEELKKTILNEETNSINLYKNVFNPDIGHTLAFIGFVQPASGGLLPMSEIQGRWFTEICRGRCSLPTKSAMKDNIQEEKEEMKSRYYHSNRHTIQRDPILYNDEISAMFGAKPELLKNPSIAWRLLLGSCGTYQYRLQGPNAWSGAKTAVMKVPVPEMYQYTGIAVVVFLAIWLLYIFSFVF
ncbi:flavin-containing monooxygenase 5-like isoform X2 [Ostrea edulis]|uniref:flavin-containing monooxygenase 5-like isoform X2 n=1 Tax=Ostrea edulis TaxID=37623 RepID=UPI0024AED6C0|nr:flavin-containing monooxygenase 5-like isoform X2 [Ostrea edulis]